MIPLILRGCPTPLVEPAQTVLAGQISLNADTSRERARLRILLHQPIAAPLPSERQGLALDTCATFVPTQFTGGEPLQGVTARAWCAGEELELESMGKSGWRHSFSGLPDPGLSCRVEVRTGDTTATFELPPLPAAPDLHRRGRQLTWSAKGADEVRLAVPRTEGRNTLCRLADDGEHRSTEPIQGDLGFATRAELAVGRLGEGRVELVSLSGAWLPAD